MNPDLLLNIYFIALLGVCSYFLLMSSTNMLEMKLHTFKPELEDGPMVTILVPARNEEKNIAQCITLLQNQTYKNYEILVIDDNSSDRTWDIMKSIVEKDSRVHVYQGKPLPPDWYGKPFALSQLCEHAKGDILLFTDADTRHSPTSVSWAVTNLVKSKADLVSGYIGQELLTLGEITTVPVMFFLTGFVIPMFLNRYVKSGYFSAAIGQYIVLKKSVFKATGGFEAFKKKTSEDIYMSRHIKESGYRTEFLDLGKQVRCRMYEGYVAGIQGIGKNIFDFLGKNPILAFVVALAIFVFFILPFPLVFVLAAIGSKYFVHCLVINILSTLTWLILFAGRGIKWYGAFLWPALYFNLEFMALWSWFRSASGKGFTWKGRVVN
ncbi:MAG: glycosyltransferase [Spirochaetaceae bacterium]|jgi:chlorobactene glucosyltransferase|nr:glycosyltransferase [Spirochaetaceae bacterium]